MSKKHLEGEGASEYCLEGVWKVFVKYLEDIKSGQDKSRIGQVGTGEVRNGQVGTGQVGTSQVRTDQVAIGHVGRGQVSNTSSWDSSSWDSSGRDTVKVMKYQLPSINY